jgi:hypothetical protein
MRGVRSGSCSFADGRFVTSITEGRACESAAAPGAAGGQAGILRHLDSAVIAWTVFAGARFADLITTAYLLESSGRNTVIELHLIPRLFMDYYGVHRGNILHEVAVVGGAVLAYIGIAAVRPQIPLMRLVSPRLVPYTIGAVSAVIAARNLAACML